LINTGAQLGTAVGLSILVTIATIRTDLLPSGAQPTAVMFAAGYRWAFIAGGILAVIGMLVAAFVARDSTGAHSNDAP